MKTYDFLSTLLDFFAACFARRMHLIPWEAVTGVFGSLVQHSSCIDHEGSVRHALDRRMTPAFSLA